MPYPNYGQRQDGLPGAWLERALEVSSTEDPLRCRGPRPRGRSGSPKVKCKAQPGPRPASRVARSCHLAPLHPHPAQPGPIGPEVLALAAALPSGWSRADGGAGAPRPNPASPTGGGAAAARVPSWLRPLRASGEVGRGGAASGDAARRGAGEGRGRGARGSGLPCR
jgi:hypothetical protein